MVKTLPSSGARKPRPQPGASLSTSRTTVARGGNARKLSASDSERRFSLLVENVTDYSIYMLDQDGIVTNWNSGAQRIKGYKADEIVGQHFERFLTEEDRQAGVPAKMLETAAKEGRFEVEGWRVRKDGSHFWANVVVDAIRDETGTLIGFAKITRDISERRRHEERLNYLAHFDTLTGLPNRQSIRTMVEEAIASGNPATVLMLDLDGFKQVNDTLGHDAGDAMLKAAGGRLQNCVGQKGIVGRLGGDEFAVLLPKIGNPIAASAICERMIDAFRAPFIWEAQESYVGLCVGFAISPSHARSADEIVSNADLALYRAKAEGRRGYCMFQPSFRQQVIANRLCDHELRQAIAEGQLELFYQPQVNLSDYRVVGIEALLRWNHPVHGLRAPGAFLHVLERGSLAPTVGDWVIREATSHAAKMRDLGFTTFRLGVNLFGAQLRRGQLLSTVTRALEENALPASALELEITENIFLQEDEALIKPLRTLHALGVGVAFDDYGTGYASLSLLKRFPLTRLKIDKSFVRDLHTDREDAAVVKAIIYLAESFGLEVIAEGIEREEQRMRLRELGCESGQGFLFGKPMPAQRIFELLAGAPCDASARWPQVNVAPVVSRRA